MIGQRMRFNCDSGLAKPWPTWLETLGQECPISILCQTELNSIYTPFLTQS